MSASSPTTRTVPPAIGAGKGRQLRLKEPHVGIERRIGEPERQLGVHLVGQRDPAGARHDESWRRRLEFGGQQFAAQRQPAGELADALVGGEEIVDAHSHVVARHVERARAGRRELQHVPRAAHAERRRVASDSTGIRAPSALNE